MLREFFEDSWTFQETLQEGRQEGWAEGVLLGEKRSIEKAVVTRFSGLVASFKKKLATLSSQEQLDQLLNAVITAQTEDELKQFLATLT